MCIRDRAKSSPFNILIPLSISPLANKLRLAVNAILVPFGVINIFLVLDNAYVKLKNRKFNSKEANTIYDVLNQLSNNVFDDSGVEARSEYLIDWLRSVTFWGKPKEGKDPGYNSIWFERADGELRLFFSGKGESLSFTPQAMETQKETIVTLLQNMYNNVNARKVQNTDEYNLPYEEIIGIGENGVPQTKEWRNYQSYLLSDEGRTADEIPLFTDITPLESPQDINLSLIHI